MQQFTSSIIFARQSHNTTLLCFIYTFKVTRCVSLRIYVILWYMYIPVCIISQIWVCLAENAIYPCDKENCFRWFSKLMGEEPDLDPEITKDFFEQNILHFDPALLTEHGIKYEFYF